MLLKVKPSFEKSTSSDSFNGRASISPGREVQTQKRAHSHSEHTNGHNYGGHSQSVGCFEAEKFRIRFCILHSVQRHVYRPSSRTARKHLSSPNQVRDSI